MLDLVVSLYFVTPYIFMRFNINHGQLLDPFVVSTPIGESILLKKIYRDCNIIINHKDTSVDSFELDMVHFDVVLGMD